jgi:hypothetical protein
MDLLEHPVQLEIQELTAHLVHPELMDLLERPELQFLFQELQIIFLIGIHPAHYLQQVLFTS